MKGQELHVLPEKTLIKGSRLIKQSRANFVGTNAKVRLRKPEVGSLLAGGNKVVQVIKTRVGYHPREKVWHLGQGRQTASPVDGMSQNEP